MIGDIDCLLARLYEREQALRKQLGLDDRSNRTKRMIRASKNRRPRLVSLHIVKGGEQAAMTDRRSRVPSIYIRELEAEIERLNDIRSEQDLEINKLRGEIERLSFLVQVAAGALEPEA